MRVQTCPPISAKLSTSFVLIVSVPRGDQWKSNIAFGDSYLYQGAWLPSHGLKMISDRRNSTKLIRLTNQTVSVLLLLHCLVSDHPNTNSVTASETRHGWISLPSCGRRLRRNNASAAKHENKRPSAQR